MSPGELNDGKYKVFVEIERNKRIHEQILELLNGIKNLTEVGDFKFRYYKSFNSVDANEENLSETIPKTKDDYSLGIQENVMNNFSNFFSRSFLENISVDHEDIVFQKMFSGPLRLRIKTFGTTKEVYENAPGHIMLENRDMSEVMFFTKYVGNYNITKIGSAFIFENNGYAVALEKV